MLQFAMGACLADANLLENSLKALSDEKTNAVSVTPVSMMSVVHWDVLARLWKPR